MNVLNITRNAKTGRRDVKQASAVGKMVPTDLSDAGLPPTFNLLKNKKQKNHTVSAEHGVPILWLSDMGKQHDVEHFQGLNWVMDKVSGSKQLDYKDAILEKAQSVFIDLCAYGP